MAVCNAEESNATVFELRPLPEYTTQGDLLRYVARTRRQLERFEHLPNVAGRTIDPEAAADIRVLCDELEADIINGLTST
jgi:hypothetical protein